MTAIQVSHLSKSGTSFEVAAFVSCPAAGIQKVVMAAISPVA